MNVIKSTCNECGNCKYCPINEELLKEGIIELLNFWDLPGKSEPIIIKYNGVYSRGVAFYLIEPKTGGTAAASMDAFFYSFEPILIGSDFYTTVFSIAECMSFLWFGLDTHDAGCWKNSELAFTCHEEWQKYRSKYFDDGKGFCQVRGFLEGRVYL